MGVGMLACHGVNLKSLEISCCCFEKGFGFLSFEVLLTILPTAYTYKGRRDAEPTPMPTGRVWFCTWEISPASLYVELLEVVVVGEIEISIGIGKGAGFWFKEGRRT